MEYKKAKNNNQTTQIVTETEALRLHKISEGPDFKPNQSNENFDLERLTGAPVHNQYYSAYTPGLTQYLSSKIRKLNVEECQK